MGTGALAGAFTLINFSLTTGGADQLLQGRQDALGELKAIFFLLSFNAHRPQGEILRVNLESCPLKLTTATFRKYGN